MIHHQFFKVTLIFFFVLVLCFVWQIIKSKMDSEFQNEYATGSLLCMILFIVLCFLPLKVLYSKARFELGKSLGRTFLTPYFPVYFRDFFLADILTSMITPIQELMIIYCYFIGPDHDWKTGTTVDFSKRKDRDPIECVIPHKIYTTLPFFIYWIRLAQCLKRYKTQNLPLQLINAAKYFSLIMTQFASLWYSPNPYDYDAKFYIWLTCHLFSTNFCIVWDTHIDFGLVRTKQPGKYGLRDQINYHPYFYYFAIIENIILRYFWIIPIFEWSQG